MEKFVKLFLVLVLSLNFAMATECDNHMKLPVDGSMALKSVTALTTEHTVYDIPKLMMDHPMNVMNAYQRAWAWINYKAKYEVKDPYYGLGKVEIYPVLSEGLVETGNKLIVGHYETLADMAGFFKRGAMGDYGATNKALSVVGPAGTGKSEWPKIFTRLSNYLTNNNPTYFLYTYEFVNIHNIPNIRPRIRQLINGDEMVPFESPMKNSPLVLLFKAPELQAKIIADASAGAQKLTDGAKPTPRLSPDPQSEFIINELIKYYAKTDPAKYGKLTIESYMDILNKHVVIRQRVRGESDKWPTIGAQGDDPNYNDLYFQSNPMIESLWGAKDPFSKHYNGQVLSSEGGVLFMDEFFRNIPPLRDTFLELMEGKVVQHGSSLDVKVDNVILVASNDESINASSAELSTLAQQDRLLQKNMRLTDRPQEVSKILVLLKGAENFEMKSLNPASGTKASYEKGDIHKLYPLPTEGRLMTHEGRYALRIKNGEGQEPIFIAPHVFEFVSMTIAASRMIVDPQVLVDANFPSRVMNERVFNDPITRLKFYNYEIEVQDAYRAELKALHSRLKEGSTGISNRSADKLLTTLIEKAESSGKNTITYGLVKDVFKKLLDEHVLGAKTNEESLKWLSLLENVAFKMIIPRLQADVMTALNGGNSDVRAIYDEIVEELLNLSRNPDAIEYISQTSGTPKTVDHIRLEEVKRMYLIENSRQLESNDLTTFMSMNKARSDEVYRPLFNAVSLYLSKDLMNSARLASIYQYITNGKGDSETAAIASRFQKIMEEQLGYNATSLVEALSFVRQYEAKTNNIGRR
ncbi:MAG: hypothetical protein JNM93_02225 [Bacteriovoracaceae bacterium]|nr:hypothetical protein [Bacteriovoracaceae bacterium]